MLKYFILLSLFFGFITYVSAQKTSKKHINSNSATKNYKLDFAPTTLITLERSRCYGTCPSYKIEIYGDGTFIYEGKDFVKTKGKVTSTVSSEQLQQIISEFEKARYFSLRNSYVDEKDGCTAMSSDSEWVHTSLKINKKRKSIKHYLGCYGGSKQFELGMQRLGNLEDKIDEIIKIEQWIGTRDERSKYTRVSGILCKSKFIE